MYRISERFRSTVNDVIARLERDAEEDSCILPNLRCEDHRKRHQRLVEAQVELAVALRVRLTMSADSLPEDFAATDFALSEGA